MKFSCFFSLRRRFGISSIPPRRRAYSLAWMTGAALGVLGFAAALVSCMAPGAPKGKILIEFWDFPRLPAVQKWLDQAIANYMVQHPEVHVQFTRLSWGKGGQRMDISAFAGRPPDVAGSVLNLKYEQAGLLEPLDSYLDEPIADLPGKTWRDDIHPAILKSVQWQGKTWAFPWYKEAFVILLNLDILKERGVEPPPNGRWTWDEFLAAMKKLTFDRDGDGKLDVYGIGFNTGPEKWEAYSFLFAEGMRLVTEDGRKMLVDSPETRRGLQRLLDLEYKEKVSLPGAGGIQDDTTWQAFSGTNRILASTCQGLWAIKSVEVQNQKLEEQRAKRPGANDLPPPLRIAAVLFPQMPGQPQRMASYGVGSLMVFKRPVDPRRTQAAARFARYLTLEAGQPINREAGLFPSRISTGNLLRDNPLYRNLCPYMAEAASPPAHPVWHQVDQVLSEHIQLALLQSETVDKAAANMGRKGQIVLDNYWKSAGESAAKSTSEEAAALEKATNAK